MLKRLKSKTLDIAKGAAGIAVFSSLALGIIIFYQVGRVEEWLRKKERSA